MVEEIPEAPRIIAFRNVLAHGYDSVSSALVWSLAGEKLPTLTEQVLGMLQPDANID